MSSNPPQEAYKKAAAVVFEPTATRLRACALQTELGGLCYIRATLHTPLQGGP
jgi:hypothetical protein